MLNFDFGKKKQLQHLLEEMPRLGNVGVPRAQQLLNQTHFFLLILVQLRDNRKITDEFTH